MFKAELTDETIDHLAIAGTPEDCARQLRPLALAGADSVVLQPLLGHEAEQIAVIASAIHALLDELPLPAESANGAVSHAR